MKLPSWMLAALLGAGVSTAWAVSEKEASEAIAAAEAATKKAASIGYEWRDTGKIIKSAKEALAGKDFEAALKHANNAKLQGERAYEQGMGQQQAGPTF